MIIYFLYFQLLENKQMPNSYLRSCIYLSLQLVKTYRQSATPALLCSDRGCADSRLLHDVTNFELISAAFFFGGGNRSTLGNHHGMIRRL